MKENVEEKKVTPDKEQVRESFKNRIIEKEKEEVGVVDNANTYFCFESESSLLEVDLLFFRQKGKEEKFLEIALTEAVDVSGEKVFVRRITEIKTKEDFDDLKEYFANLSWD